MEISSVIAQEIVLQLKNVLSQEINFMNSESIIIASTDKSRIGHFHAGADTVLKNKKPLIIDDDSSFKGSKQGINMPIALEDKVIGVVGITGERCKVEKNGIIIKKMTEILIKEDLIKDINIKKHDRSRYIINRILNHHLINSNNESSNVFNYDYTLPHLCIIGEFKTTFNYQYEEIYRIITRYTHTIDDVIFIIIEHKLYLFVQQTSLDQLNIWLKILSDKITSYFNVPYYFGIGPVSDSLVTANQSFDYAANALHWNKLYAEKQYLHFNELDLGLILTSIDKSRISLIQKKILQCIPPKEYEELKEIFLVYGEMNKSINKSADKLYIHKNSFQYKLNKLTQYTGYDPKILNDYVCLYIAFLLDYME